MAKTVVGKALSSVLSKRKTTTPSAGMRLRVSNAMPALFILPGRKTREQRRWTPGESLLGDNDSSNRVLGLVCVAARPVCAALTIAQSRQENIPLPNARRNGLRRRCLFDRRSRSFVVSQSYPQIPSRQKRRLPPVPP